MEMAEGFLTAFRSRFASAAAYTWEKATDILLNQETEPEDPKTKFEDACKVANDFLKSVTNEFGLPGDEISATDQQLQKKEVTISTHGRHSCGKSTLLNALLNDSLLPTCLENNTGIRVTIKHSDSVHRGMCPNPKPCAQCPKLRVTWTGAHVPPAQIGARDIRNKLEEINEMTRKSTSQVDEAGRQVTECILSTNLPTMSGVECGWEVSILDNPGYGEADQEGMMRATETTMKSSSALLYVMDVGQLQDSEDARCLKQLYNADKGIFADSNRLTVAVTQFDKTYTDSKEWSVEEVRTKVCEFIKCQTGIEVHSDAVIPVCGKWAFDARQLIQKQCQDDKALLTRVKVGLMLCPNAPGGQESMSQEEPSLLAERLLKLTGIEVLEKRIEMMASVCVRTWVSSLSQKYHNYLEMATERFDQNIQDTSDELERFKKSHLIAGRHYDELASLTKDLEDKTLHEKLKRHCTKDINAANESVQKIWADFHTKCCSEIEAQKKDFGPKEFECQAKELFAKEFSEKLCATVFDASSGFKNGWKVRDEAMKKMKEDIKRMKRVAEDFLGETSTDETLPASDEVQELSGNLKGVFKEKKLTFDNFKEEVDIPELRLTWGQWFTKGFRWHFSKLKLMNPPVYSYSSAELAETMKQTRRYVEETFQSFFQGLELSVAEYFFSSYRRSTESCLRSFKKKYKDRVDKQKKEGDKCIRDLTAKLQSLRKSKVKVQEFRQKLKCAFEEYSEVLDVNTDSEVD